MKQSKSILLIFFVNFLALVACDRSQDNSPANHNHSEPEIQSDSVDLLTVSGSKIVNESGQVVSLAGNSFFWSNTGWGAERFFNAQIVKWLKEDWNTKIIRVPIGVDGHGGYLEQPNENLKRVKKVIDAAITENLYVIIDWHSHYAHLHTQKAIDFFKQMAREYGHYNHVIYEIYNEPLFVDDSEEQDGNFATWNEHIHPYALQVIAAIREIDPDNLIAVGTGEWSQKVDDAAKNPITEFNNIAYVLHFYSVHHQQWLRNRANDAIAAGLPIIVTEWGPMGDSVEDPESEAWMAWCKQHKLIHCAWAVNDKVEPWSIIKPGASEYGNWSDSVLTPAGIFEKQTIKNW